MRKPLLSMISCASLLMACQPVTPLSLKNKSASPNSKMNDGSPIPPSSVAPPVPQTPPVQNMPNETLSSDLLDQNHNQTKIGPAVSTVRKSSETLADSAQASSDITPKALAMNKTFDPTKIIGFATPILVHKLGKPNMVRKEGPVEVWQYQFVSCVVDFFFYPIGEDTSQLILKIWDMRSTTMGYRLDRGRCRNEMNLYYQKVLSNS